MARSWWLVLAAVLCLLQTAAFVASESSPKDKMMASIANNKVQVFSKSYCPYCKNVKSLFKELQIDHHVDELDQMSDGAQIQEELLKLTGQRTVPNVFVGGNHVGGNDDTLKAKASGKLRALLVEAGVSVPDEL